MLIAVFFGIHSFTTVALSVNLVTYFNHTMHLQIATAANLVTSLLGTSFILSVAVACLADTVVGRYRVAMISAWIEFLVLSCTFSCFSVDLIAFKYPVKTKSFINLVSRWIFQPNRTLYILLNPSKVQILTM